MSRVVPVAFVSTDEAINEFLNADPKWRRLSEAWRTATGAAKHQSYGELSDRQDRLTHSLFVSVREGELHPVALEQGSNGEWTELRLPSIYWYQLSGELGSCPTEWCRSWG